MRVIVLGHSVAAGFMDSEGGWSARLKEELTPEDVDDPDDYFEIYNLAVSGFTTEDVRKQLPHELEVRQNVSELMVIIQIGVNDPLYLLDEERHKVSKSRFRENLEYIMEQVEDEADHLVVLGEPDMSIDGVLPWEETESLSKKDVLEYENIKKGICEERGIDLIDLKKELPSEFTEELADGLHPTGKGHQMMADVIKRKLERRI